MERKLFGGRTMQIYMNDKLRERLTALVEQKTAEELGLSDADVADASTEEIIGRLIQKHCKSLVDEEAWYEEELNEVEDDVVICGFHYGAGSALRELDPTAFRCGVLEALNDHERWINVNERFYCVLDVARMLVHLGGVLE